MLTAIEWIVVVFSILGLLKILVIVTGRRRWLPVIHEVYGNPNTFNWLFLVLALIIFYFLVQAMTIVEIMAVMGFTCLLVAIALMHYSKDMQQIAKKIITSKITGWLWFYILIWTVLMVWSLWFIFA